jgi:hypothetical protein
VNPSLMITALAERAMSLWSNNGDSDARSPLGSGYKRCRPAMPRKPIAQRPSEFIAPLPAAVTSTVTNRPVATTRLVHNPEFLGYEPARNLFALALACAGGLDAQGAPDDNKLLTTFQNPVGDLISVPFQNNVNFPIGEFSRVQDVLNIQPVIPFHLSEDWILISRSITPVVYQPDLGSGCVARGRDATLACETSEIYCAANGGAN